MFPRVGKESEWIMSRLPVVIPMVAFGLACGENVTDPAAFTVEILASQDTLTALGDTVQLSAVVRDTRRVVRDGAGIPVEVGVTWRSSEPAILRVIDGGAVAEGPGSAIVTAIAADGSEGALTLVVRQIAVEVQVVPAESTVVELDSVAVQGVARDANGFAVEEPNLSWSVNPPALARLEDGLLVGLAQGTVEVRAETDGTAGTATVIVTDGFLVRTIDASDLPGVVCAIDLDSLGSCWGESADSAWPAPGSVRFASLTAGYLHYCGVDGVGAGFCWGRNLRGQLGMGTNTPSSVNDSLVRAHDPMTFTFLRATAHDFTCGLASDGTPYCWGHNDRGQLGRGFRSGDEFDAQPPTGVPTMTVIDGGPFHACGIGTDGATYCWGIAAVGDGTDGSDSPVTVSGGHSFVTLSTGFFFTCAVTTGDETFCWGLNYRGQLGTGDTTNSFTPRQVVSAPAFAAITAGSEHACGLTADGSARCWGANDQGQLGDGTTLDRGTPVAAQPALTFTDLAAGYQRTCGIVPGGAVFCWGGGDPAPRRILRKAAEGSAGIAAAAVVSPPPHEP